MTEIRKLPFDLDPPIETGPIQFADGTKGAFIDETTALLYAGMLTGMLLRIKEGAANNHKKIHAEIVTSLLSVTASVSDSASVAAFVKEAVDMT